MLTIGLTGGIGSGKSTVSQWFRTKDVPVMDADDTVHRLLQSDPQIISQLVEEFGKELLAMNGQIDRSMLGQRVFQDSDARKRLERIVHPRVIETMQAERAGFQKAGMKFCVWDVPLLFEAGLERFVDEIWVVWVSHGVQIERVLMRDKLSPEDISARIAAQWPLADKRKQADVVIDNSGSRDETKRQLEAAWYNLQKHTCLDN